MNRLDNPTESKTEKWALAPTLLLPLLLLLVLAGCATSGDVGKLAQENRVQNQRLAAIEQTSGQEIAKLSEELQAAREKLRTAEGRLLNMSKKVERLLREQTALAEGQEKAIAQVHAARRRLAKLEKSARTFRIEQKQETDALRLSMADLEKLMKSPIAGLPSKTKADKAFREAFANMVGGQLDIAADRFHRFARVYKQDPRVPEAKYRRGQAFFLMRKYDHAIVPFFELLDKFGKHKLAVNARWMLARSLEETGDLKLAREFYAQLIAENSAHKSDSTRRVYFIDQLYPRLKKPPAPKSKAPSSGKPRKDRPANQAKAAR